MSASITPTWCPACANNTARLAATVDFPTPPLPEEIARILPRLGYWTGVGGGGTFGGGCGAGVAPEGAAAAAGFLTAILIRSLATPSTASTATRAWRTRVAGSS